MGYQDFRNIFKSIKNEACEIKLIIEQGTWFPILKPLECQKSTNQTQSWSKVLAIHRFLSITHRFPFGFYYETAGRNGCTNLDIEAMDTDFHGGLQVIGLQVVIHAVVN